MIKYENKLTTVTWVIIATGLVWLVYDVYLFATDQDTISKVLTEWSYYTPAIPFVFGLLCGHWFWPAKVTREK